MLIHISKTLENKVVPYGCFGFCDHGIVSMHGGTHVKAYDGFITNNFHMYIISKRIYFQIIITRNVVHHV
jgi:hypothetical protein